MNWTPKNIAIAGAVVLVGGWYLKRKAGEAVDAVTTAVNPTDQNNLANRGFNGLYSAVTDGKGTLGTDTHEALETLGGYYKYTPLGLWDRLTGGES